jgi:hypothetical protein
VGIQRLESRQIDAEIIRTNLKRFTEVFEKLTLPERKDFLRLLIKDILYDHQQGKIKLTLRQLPDLDIEVIDGKVSFDERQIWLPGQDSNLGHADYRAPSRFRKAWTISSPSPRVGFAKQPDGGAGGERLVSARSPSDHEAWSFDFAQDSRLASLEASLRITMPVGG